MHAFGHGERLLAALDSAGSRDNSQTGTSDCGCSSREANDCIFFFDVAADELIGLRNLNDFLHAGHFFQRALLDFTLVSGDADGGASGSGHGMRPVPKFLDLLANRAHLFFGGLGLHDNQHRFTLREQRVGTGRPRPSGRAMLDGDWEKAPIKSTVARSAPQMGQRVPKGNTVETLLATSLPSAARPPIMSAARLLLDSISRK